MKCVLIIVKLFSEYCCLSEIVELVTSYDDTTSAVARKLVNFVYTIALLYNLLPKKTGANDWVNNERVSSNEAELAENRGELPRIEASDRAEIVVLIIDICDDLMITSFYVPTFSP